MSGSGSFSHPYIYEVAELLKSIDDMIDYVEQSDVI